MEGVSTYSFIVFVSEEQMRGRFDINEGGRCDCIGFNAYHTECECSVISVQAYYTAFTLCHNDLSSDVRYLKCCRKIRGCIV
ncbi:hypothetical protein CEXT_284471 [Caerostris extrusa]|uniref:Uncharacterized protein n=1 Tax=Caerostris extrusa TaxID=172846 RepID=A0AAV4RMZ7_CAEEX|nr:hypothetical protein CEXT_284471 [Caerostris extrusa]